MPLLPFRGPKRHRILFLLLRLSCLGGSLSVAWSSSMLVFCSEADSKIGRCRRSILIVRCVMENRGGFPPFTSGGFRGIDRGKMCGLRALRSRCGGCGSNSLVRSPLCSNALKKSINVVS